MRMTPGDNHRYGTSIYYICGKTLEGYQLFSGNETHLQESFWDESVDPSISNPGMEDVSISNTKERKRRTTVRHRQHCDEGIFHKRARFIAPVHLDCNLNVQSNKHLTALFHNFQNFDSSYIISGISKLRLKKIEVIAKSDQKDMCIKVEGRFLDSFVHRPYSMQSLVDGVRLDGIKSFGFLKRAFPFLKMSNITNLVHKQAFPYDLVNEKNLREERNSLPDIQCFILNLRKDILIKILSTEQIDCINR
jgi:hypothetical protein